MRSTRGQASIELVSLCGLVAAGLAAVVQIVLAGQAVWASGQAAAAAARAAAVGGDARAAAAAALPAHLERHMRVRTLTAGGVEVRVRVPAVLPGLDPGPVRSTSAFVAQR